MNHTPGPWKVVRRGTVGDFSILGTEFVSGEAQTTHTAGIAFDILHEANAHLIAAAPAMYEALSMAQATIERLQRHAPGSAIGTLDVIKAAIAQAEGK